MADDDKASDPIHVLKLLQDAILKKPNLDQEEVLQALHGVLSKYEQHNRVFLIAAAKAELPRVIRLMEFINSCESNLLNADRLERASTKELIKIYALAQSNLLTSVDSIRKVADMRLEALKAAGGADGVAKLFDMKGSELDALAGLPGLEPQERDRVRKLVHGIVDALDADDSVEVVADEPTDAPPDDQE